MSDGALPVRLAQLRATEFPWTTAPGTRTLYLNNAATGPLPARSVALLDDWTHRRMTPWRITDHETVFPALRRTRESCARLVGATAAEIALTPNTSYGLSLAAQALPLRDGDVIVASADEFPTVVAAWRTTQPTRHLDVRLVPTRDGWPDEDALIRELDRSAAKVLAVSWVGYATGYRLDLERLGAACKERGVYFVVDAMQGLGVAELDVKRAEIDVLACGGFKWLLAPWGSGMTFIRADLIQQMNPPALGWLFSPRQEDYTSGLVFDAPLYDDARRFEVMTLPSQDMAALGCSVDLLLEIGMAQLESAVRSLADQIVSWAARRRDVHVVTPSDPRRRAGIVSLAMPNVEDVSQRLRGHGVIHSLRQGALRFSPHVYNTPDEVDLAMAMLDSLLVPRVAAARS